MAGGDKWDRLRVRTPILNGGQTQLGEFFHEELLIFTKWEFSTGYKRLIHCLPKFWHPYLHFWYTFRTAQFSFCFLVLFYFWMANFGRKWMNLWVISPYCVLPILYQTFISWIYEIQRNISAIKSRMLLDKWFELIVISISFATSDKCTSTFMSSTKMGVLTFCQAVKGNMTNLLSHQK